MIPTLPVYTLIATLAVQPGFQALWSPESGKPEPTETVIRLRLKPAAAPIPALRYQLLPTLEEINPGNPIQSYLGCFMEENQFFFGKSAVDNRIKWEKMSLKDLPLKELAEFGYGKGREGPLTKADYAARLNTVDWQILPRLKIEGYKLLLPELQQLRVLAVCLKIRFRVEVAEGRVEDALGTAKTMFAMARHLGQHPTVIGGLVGTAVAGLALGPLEELMDQPDCPNLYWALINLSRPLIDTRSGFQSERYILQHATEFLNETEPMTNAQLDQALEKLRVLIQMTNLNQTIPGMNEDLGTWIEAQARDEKRVEAARTHLIELGLSPEKVKTFPARQVLFLEDKLVAQNWRDDDLKLTGLPFWEAETILVNRKLPQTATGSLIIPFVGSGFRPFRLAQVRIEQRMALLTVIQALRLHAADHQGQLPANLSEIKLPLPVDPVTGKAFDYQLVGEVARLHGTPPRGKETNASYNIRYEISMRK